MEMIQVRTAPHSAAIAAGGLLFVGYLGIYTAPFQISALAQAGTMTVATAGMLVSIHIASTACGALLSTRLGTRIPQRLLVTLGIVLAAFAYLGFASDRGMAVLIIARMIAGLGSGLALGTANAVVAAMTDPEKGYGRANALMLVGFAILLSALPHIVDQAYPDRLPMILAIVCFAALPASRWVPNTPAGGTIASAMPTSKSRTAIALFTGATLYFLISGGTYALSGQAAERASMPQPIYGLALSLFALIGIATSLFVGLTGSRWGRTLPVTLGCLGTTLSLLAIVSQLGWGIIAIGLLGYGALSIFTLNYIMGTAAALDRSGRLAASLGGFALLPYAFGPSIFTFIAEQLEWSYLAPIVAAAGALASLLMMLLARQTDAKKEGMSQ